MPIWRFEFKRDSTYKLLRTYKESTDFSSFGNWSLNNNTLVIKNNISFEKDIIEVNRKVDPAVNDSSIIIRIVDSAGSPMSGFLSYGGSKDTTFNDKDFFFDQKSIPSSTQSFRLFVPFAIRNQLYFAGDFVGGNVWLFRVRVENPKNYDYYDSMKFLVRSRGKKLQPFGLYKEECVLIKGKQSKRIGTQKSN